ncbi:MAG TPA: hypothetical protein VG796_24995 [Verrucomicrobiales bacterium]|jgi:hypothetical protein|nr:hypothetical protein [Verrucomicrobiales bacterium]
MSERRTLTLLVLLVLAAAGYILWKQMTKPPVVEESPVKVEAEERAKADPFPAKPQSSE